MGKRIHEEPMADEFWSEVQAATQRADARDAAAGHPPLPDLPPIGTPFKGPQTGGMGQGSKGYTTYTPKECHKPPKEGWRGLGHGVYVCAGMDLQSAVNHGPDFRLILDCRPESNLQLSAPAKVLAGPRSLTRLVERHNRKPAAIVKLSWPDFGLPPVPPTFFTDLARWLNGAPVLCVCMGGHGRSGTAGACLLAAYGVDHPIKAVRAAHCKKAVETAAQAQFVERVIDARRKGSR